LLTINDTTTGKYAEFTPKRWASLLIWTDEINAAVKKLREKTDYVKFSQHIGGGWHVSVTTGVWCVDLRKFYISLDRRELKPSLTGIGLRLREWDEIPRIAEEIRKAFPSMKTVQPCYCSEDHSKIEIAFECRECNAFPDLLIGIDPCISTSG
jgi:hypothetical protein